MSPKKKALWVSLILVIYVVIAILGFLVAYYVKTTYIDPQRKAYTVPTTTPIPAPSGYKTYQDTEQKFSVFYPEALQVKENPIGFGVKTVELRSEENTDTAYQADIQILTVPKHLAKAIGQDFETYITMEDGSSKTIESPVGENKSAEQFTKVRTRDINGLRALDYTSVPSPNPDRVDPEIGTFVEAGDNIIMFATSSDNRAQLEEVLRTFTYTQ
jgi:hypothetical protein